MVASTSNTCQYGTSSYALKETYEKAVYKIEGMIALKANQQWHEQFEQLQKKHIPRSEINTKHQSKKIAEMVYDNAVECYLEMIDLFEKEYEKETEKFLKNSTGDKIRFVLSQFCTRLFMNAADSVVEKVGKDKTTETFFKIKMKVKESEFIFAVKDTGIGFDKGRSEQLNSDSFKSDKGNKVWTLGGLGIDLAEVRKKISLYKGTFKLSSKGKDQGAKAWATFTLSQEEMPKPNSSFYLLWKNCETVEKKEDLSPENLKTLLSYQPRKPFESEIEEEGYFNYLFDKLKKTPKECIRK